MVTEHMSRPQGLHHREYQSQQSPSVDGAYDFVAQSYDLAARRLESIERRIDQGLIFIVTATFAAGGAVLALAPESTDINLTQPPLMLPMSLFLIAVAAGVFSNLVESGLFIPSPRQIYQDNLSYTTLEFRQKVIYAAEQHFEKNRSTIIKKRNFLILMYAAFILELMAGANWLTIIF